MTYPLIPLPHTHLVIDQSIHRKDAHNKLLELQGNIRVICRVRPILDMERNKGGEGQAVDVTEILSEEDISIQKDYQTKTTYEYDRVFPPSASQRWVDTQYSHHYTRAFLYIIQMLSYIYISCTHLHVVALYKYE